MTFIQYNTSMNIIIVALSYNNENDFTAFTCLFQRVYEAFLTFKKIKIVPTPLTIITLQYNTSQ